MLIYGGEVTDGPPELLYMASVYHRSQGINWLGRVVLKVDLVEYLGTSKIRNLGCGFVGPVEFDQSGLVELLLIQVGLLLLRSP